MTWYADNSICDYFPFPEHESLRAIGWLERGHEFTTGSVEPEVYDRLEELLRDPWQPVVCACPHECDLCRFRQDTVGSANLFVPGDGVVFVCPELILHYINAHEYAPPREFCSAVLSCPNTRSMEYKKALLKSGLNIGELTR